MILWFCSGLTLVLVPPAFPPPETHWCSWFGFLLFTLLFNVLLCEVTATALCPWIPLCCSSVFPTLIMPSSLIKLHVSPFPCSFSPLSHCCSSSHSVCWLCMLSSLSSQPADVQPDLPPVLTDTNTNTNHSPSAVLLLSAPGLGRAELSEPPCTVLLIAGVYPNTLLEKVTPVQRWFKWKLVYYACGSSCRQLIKQPAVARCLLEILWDAAPEDGLDALQPCLWVGSARLGGFLCPSRRHCTPAVHTVLTTGVWSFAKGGCTPGSLGGVLALRGTPFKYFYISG